MQMTAAAIPRTVYPAEWVAAAPANAAIVAAKNAVETTAVMITFRP